MVSSSGTEGGSWVKSSGGCFVMSRVSRCIPTRVREIRDEVLAVFAWHPGAVLLEIRGHHFPGRSWHLDTGPCDNVHVGIQVRRDPADLVPGDSEDAV